jgi:hypothetical protein
MTGSGVSHLHPQSTGHTPKLPFNAKKASRKTCMNEFEEENGFWQNPGLLVIYQHV